MWALFVLVATVSNVMAHIVDQYPTQADCVAKQRQFEQEFTVAYPGDEDWAFVCVRLHSEKTP
jgi:hypothetical protein